MANQRENAMNMIDTVETLSKRVPMNTETYTAQDGLKRCKVCNYPVETEIEICGEIRRVRCVCECKAKEIRAQEEKDRKEKIERERYHCFAGIRKHVKTNMASWNFANDDRRNPKLSDAMKRYAENFKDFRQNGQGLLLFGNVGSGKSYYAACIANALIDSGIPVLMTNFAILANEIQKVFEARQEYIDSLQKYDLLIIDDLGAERSSEYMQEIVFNLVDSRYRSGLPMIITTNLTASELQNPKDIQYARIYDRLLEKCLPVEISGISRRKMKLVNMAAEMKSKLGLREEKSL